MCIIVVVPAGVNMPSDETLKECFRRNPDGAGFMWSDGKEVHIRKGFMKWDDFDKALNAEFDAGRIFTDSTVVMHFRITTSGKTQPKCCHPFPISSKKEDLQALSVDSRWGIAHNGVIHGRHTADGWSDTMDFVADVVAPLARMHPSFMYSEDAKELLGGACRSKLAIINHAGEYMLVGEFNESDGVFYSNTSYIPLRYSYTSYNSVWDKWDDVYGDFDWDDDWDKPWDEFELPFESCEVCPMCTECDKKKAYCTDEVEALDVCADLNDCSRAEVLEMLGYPPELLLPESEVLLPEAEILLSE